MSEILLNCYVCKRDKPSVEFNKNKNSKTGHAAFCRGCQKIKSREHYLKNQEKEKLRSRKYHQDHLEERREKGRARYNSEEAHEYYEANKERANATSKKWRANNRERVRKIHREWARKQRKTNPHYVIKQRMSTRVRDTIKNHKGIKEMKCLEYIGCSYNELKNHLEKQFTEGMTWEKFMSGEIQIDHIKPCCSFDLSRLEDQKVCFHYTNLCPMWAKDNGRKRLEDIKLKVEKQLIIEKETDI